MTPQERTRYAALAAVAGVSALSLILTFVCGHAGANAPLTAAMPHDERGPDAGQMSDGDDTGNLRGMPSQAPSPASSRSGSLSLGDPAGPVPNLASGAVTYQKSSQGPDQRPGQTDGGASNGNGGIDPGGPGGPLTFRAMVPADWLEIQGGLAYEHALAIAAQQDQLLPADNPKVLATQAILKRLLPFAMKWNDRAQNWKWAITVVHSPELDAVCLPGGKILINDGLIDRLGLNEDETALLIAHLMAHALREHARAKIGEELDRRQQEAIATAQTTALANAATGTRFSAASGATPATPAAASGVASGRASATAVTSAHVPAAARQHTKASAAGSAASAGPASAPSDMIGAPGAAPVSSLTLSNNAVDVVPALLAMRYEAADETEADVIGADMASRAGYDPRAGLALWQKVALIARWRPATPIALDHPVSEKRLADLKKRQKDMLPLYARAVDTTVDALPAYRTGRWTPPKAERAHEGETGGNGGSDSERGHGSERDTHRAASPFHFLTELPHRLAALFK